MYDIIGDIHGHNDMLEKLLQKLGYQKRNGVYRHPERKAIFLGDLIDRGTKQKETLEIVFAMIDAGNAYSSLGNHEFNAIMYATEGESGYLRSHSAKNTLQHQAFLNAFPFGSKAHRDIISRLKELPVYLDLNEFRCIHACWHQPSIDRITPVLNPNQTSPDNLLAQFGVNESLACRDLELLLKGPEVDLPESVSFDDHHGINRTTARLLWWESDEALVESRLSMSDKIYNKDKLAQLNIEEFPTYQPHEPAIFFGHYWMQGIPKPMADNAVCLDFSVANNGYLTAYRWNEDQPIDSSGFVFVGHEAPDEDLRDGLHL
jgi:hypothetical protein